MDISEEFRQIRRVSTPLVAVSTPDYRAIMKQLAAVRINGSDEEPPIVTWNIVSGHSGYNETGNDAANDLGAADDTVAAPAMFLERLRKLPEQTIAFMVIPNNQILEDAQVVQAIANLRDLFKQDARTLVLLGRSLDLPALIADDVVHITDVLPDDEELRAVIVDTHKYAKIEPPKDLTPAIAACRGMTRFAAEEAVARKLRKSGLDIQALSLAQRAIIEQTTNRALVFERSTETFDQVGGLAGFRGFMDKVVKGPKRPELIVRFDEIDKEIGANASGSVADNTGTSQYVLKTLLTNMEDKKIEGAILCGGPGTGKTLCTVCTGNTYGIRTCVGDLGSTKDSRVGESERMIRQLMDVITSIGKDRVLFFATANRLDTLPPEFQRRFQLGIWFFDVPSAQERDAIWKIQLKRFDMDQKLKRPEDSDWVGSDIRNCVKTAWMLGTDLKDASRYLTLSGKVAKSDIDKLRDLAERSGFISANSGEPYRKPTQNRQDSRKLSV